MKIDSSQSFLTKVIVKATCEGNKRCISISSKEDHTHCPRIKKRRSDISYSKMSSEMSNTSEMVLKANVT